MYNSNHSGFNVLMSCAQGYNEVARCPFINPIKLQLSEIEQFYVYTKNFDKWALLINRNPLVYIRSIFATDSKE